MSHEDQAQAEIQNNTATAEETPAITPEVTPGAPASDTSSTTDLPTEQPEGGRRVSGVSDYEKLLAEARKPAPEPSNDPEAGGNPPENPEVPAGQQPAEQATEQSAITEEEPQASISSKKEFRPRLSNLDARAQEAILLAKELKEQGKEISLAEAERRVNAKYGITEDAPSGEQQEAVPVRTPEQIDAEIAAKEAAADQASDDLDVKTALTLQREAFALREEKARLIQEQAARSTQAEAQFHQEVERSRHKALEVYPVASQEDHPLHAKAAEIFRSMEETGNPLIHDPNAPFKVYQMAANELGIPPHAKATPAPAKSPTSATPKPQAVPQSAVRRPNPASPVASAGERTTQAGPTTPLIGKIRNAHEYTELARKMGANV
jgi:hypothetical protein